MTCWPETLKEFEYDFSTFAKFLRALCGQMSEPVSQYTEGRCISFCSKLKNKCYADSLYEITARYILIHCLLNAA